MKKVTVILQTHTYLAVVEKLLSVGISGIIISEAKGFGHERGQKETYRGASYRIFFLPKVKMELWVDVDQIGPAIESIMNTAYSGSIGDGKIWVESMEAPFIVNSLRESAEPRDMFYLEAIFSPILLGAIQKRIERHGWDGGYVAQEVQVFERLTPEEREKFKHDMETWKGNTSLEGQLFGANWKNNSSDSF